MSATPVQFGTNLMVGIPPELKRAIGCAENIIQHATVEFTGGDVARIHVDMIPEGGSNSNLKGSG